MKERMLPVFPLGVKKDANGTREPWPRGAPPSFDADRLAGVIGRIAPRPPPRFCDRLPARALGRRRRAQARRRRRRRRADRGDAPDARGDQRGLRRHPHPELRPRVARRHVLRRRPDRGARRCCRPAAPTPHVLVAFNAPSLAKFGPAVVSGGIVIYDSSVVAGPADAPARASAWWACRAAPAPRSWAARWSRTSSRWARSGDATPALPAGDVPDGDPPRPPRQAGHFELE